MSKEGVEKYKAALLNYTLKYGNEGPNSVEELEELAKIDDMYFELSPEEQDLVDRELIPKAADGQAK